MPRDREAYSLDRLVALGRELQPVQHILDEAGLCVYATGSYGRLEAWTGSDIDLFFLQGADDGDFPFTKLVRVMAQVIEAAEKLEFPPFTDDGRYLEVQ